MIRAKNFERLTEDPGEELRLIREAKSGGVKAFVKLCDPQIEHVYRYVHFLVPANRIAEGVVYQIFFKAWEKINKFPTFGSSFTSWLFEIAREHINRYCETHRHGIGIESEVALASQGNEFWGEYQSIRRALNSVSKDQRHFIALKFFVGMPDDIIARLLSKHAWDFNSLQMSALYAMAIQLGKTEAGTLPNGVRHSLERDVKRILVNASTLGESLRRHPEHRPHLEPLLETVLLLDLGAGVRPSLQFKNYTHDGLTQYLRVHQHKKAAVVSVSPAFMRASMAAAMLVMALVTTGTVQAQSALPGEALYSLKRVSETVWQAVSPNQAATDFALSQRRLDEWIAVSANPALSNAAKTDYQSALDELQNNGGNQNQEEIAAGLERQQAALAEAGLFSPVLNDYLALTAATLPDQANPAAVPPVIVISTTVTPAASVLDAAATECASPNCDDVIKSDHANPNNNGVGNPGTNNAGGNKDDAGEKGNKGGNSDENDGNGGGNPDNNGNGKKGGN